MNLAIDPATVCGWAIGDSAGVLGFGSVKLKLNSKEPAAMRYLRLIDLLEELKARYPITAVYYEKVMAHAGTEAAHVYGGLEATIQKWAHVARLPLHPVPVGTIKKNFTGKGNASKEEMVAEAKKRLHDVQDDNAADAVAILYYAVAPKEVAA